MGHARFHPGGIRDILAAASVAEKRSADRRRTRRGLFPAIAGLLQIRNMQPTAFTHWAHFDEWSPAAELRVDFMYQLTRSVSAGVGWTGFWVDGIARGSSLVDYRLGQTSAETMGISNFNRQDVFINGANFRIVLNR